MFASSRVQASPGNGRLQEQVREVIKIRLKPSDLFSVGLTLAALLPILSVQAQTKPEGSPDLPVRSEIHRQYRLAPNTTVKISMIAGAVEIDTTPGESAEINIVNSAETQADLNCADIPIEQTPGKLVIRSRPLDPAFTDAFLRDDLGLLRFTRKGQNRVSGLLLMGGALRFERRKQRGLLILYLDSLSCGHEYRYCRRWNALLIPSPSILTLGYQFDEERRRIC